MLDGPLGAVLDAGERARAHRLATHDDARRFVLSHVATRQILATYLGADPAALTWDVGPHGKPGPLDDGRVRWNLSHSGELAAVAVSTSTDVGVDVQVLDPGWTRTGSPDASSRHDSVARRDRPRRAVFQALARKEACAKAVGGRLLDLLDLDTRHPGVVTCVAGPWAGHTWWLSDLDVPDGHVGALAVPGEDARTLRTTDWPWPAERGAR
ncbi:hypothetical protein NKG05_14595 [Oerskovia sp. M15]